MSLSIPGYRYIFVAGWCFLGKLRNHIRITLVLALAPCRKPERQPFHLDVHCQIDQGEKAMSWSHPRKPWLFTVLDPPKEGFHRPIQTEIDLLQKLAVDKAQFRVMLLTLLQRLLCLFPSGPSLTVAQAHNPPVVQAPTFSLHKFQGCSVLVADFKPDFLAYQHFLLLPLLMSFCTSEGRGSGR